jgi:predicted enzyme related to lactoylglutathione lyase
VDVSEREKSIDYIDFRVTDLTKAEAFHGGVFGWSFTDYGEGYSAFTDPRATTGGLAANQGAPTAGSTLVIMYAGDLEAAAGAAVRPAVRSSEPIFSFPGGRRCHCADPSGNVLGVWSER